ncbi:succinate dehydrogenase [Pelagivirga sediminicola]|uniref:Succinate dehydrogenase n=1 Tax=Pelagivirga sediminicola TaxID=2170575 RepID=A0A2T7G6Q9_9RHOB|nr:succinate dehydrogenase [Pelagivirga sediminicola]PVA10110.1 succinate dehydrogenase [Pelagivirga sediminicola]
MRALGILAVCATALSACATANDMADDLARGRAKAVVNGYVADRYPGLNAAPITDCIIDAADARDIMQIASATVTGLDAATAEQISRIARRPESIQCIARNGVTLLS